MRPSRLTLATALMLLQCAGILGAPLDLWFERANQAYENRQYDSAEVYYNKIIDAGVHNSSVHYNLANTYFRQNRNGPAILHYERALRLAPNDPDIKTNLKFVGMHLVDQISPPERGMLETILVRFHTLLPLSVQLWLLVGLLTVSAILYASALFVSRNVRLWLVYLGSLVATAVVLLGVSAGIKIYEEEMIDYAIVMEESVDAVNQPDGRTVLFTAHEGTKFRVRKRATGWWLVSLPNGVSGWVSERVLETI